MAAAPGHYRAPVAEYEFLLGEAFGADLVARASEGELSAADAVDALAAAGEFAEEVFAPLDREGDRVGSVVVDGGVRTPEGFPVAWKAFSEAGWMSACAPGSAGGEGLPSAVQAALVEFWNGANASFALACALSTGAIHALDASASEELRETYLPNMVSGVWTGTMNLTEPQAGSDLGAIRTIARDRGDGSWEITGQKIFITWGDHDVAENIVHLVLARTEGAPEGHRGLSLFVAPKFLVNPDGSLGERNRIATLAVEHKIGIHASPTCQLAFEGATGYLVGELHQGLAGMFVMMNSARIGIGIQGLGVAERAFQRAHEYAAVREQGAVMDRPAGTPIAEHPDVKRLLLSMSSSISAMRAFSVLVADLRDRGESELADFFVPVLKNWFADEAVRIASDAVQVHGGSGFVEETGAGQHYRDARIIPIYEGTSAIQANDLIGRKTLRDEGRTARRVLGLAAEAAQTLRGLDHPVARRTADRLDRALASAERAIAAILGFGATRDAYAAGVPFATLVSRVAGGWMHAVVVSAVLAREERSARDEERLVEADFYGAHQLAEVHALAETVEAGEIG